MSTSSPTSDNNAGSSPRTDHQLSHLLPCTDLTPTITLSETFDEENDLSCKTNSISLSQNRSYHQHQSPIPAPQALAPEYSPSRQRQPARRTYGTQSHPLPLLSLPIDALHTVSTFLEVRDWCSVSLVDRAAHMVCSNVFQRVRMHGFKCAAEIITAWEAGEHGDAKELAALYLQSGVPIYPARRRDIYHTLLQRMKVEATEMIQPTDTNPNEGSDNNNNVNSNTNNDTSTMADITDTSQHTTQDDGDSTNTHSQKRTVDRFYLERKDARDTGGYYLSTLTYLEEKSLFWREDCRTDRGTGGGTARQGINQPRNNPRQGAQHPPHAHRNGAAAGNGVAANENLRHYLHHYYPPEELGIFHDYDTNQIRTFGDPDVAVVAAPIAGEPIRNQPVPPGGREGQGRYTRNDLNHLDRHARMTTDMVSRLPQLRRSVASNISTRAPSLISLASSDTETIRHGNKMTLHCHRHLVDRHYLGRPAVFDGDGVMNAAPINMAADFFHPVDSGSGSGGSDGVLFGFGGLPRRDLSGRRMGVINPGGAGAASVMVRPNAWHQNQTQMPHRFPIHTAATGILDEEEQLAEPSPPNTEHSGETLFLTPPSSPTTVTEGDDNTPPPEQFVDYPAAQVETAGLTPPPLRHSNYTPHQSPPPPSVLLDVPVLEGSSYHTRSQASPLPYNNVGTMSSGGSGGFSRATFPFVVELNVMNDVALHLYSSTFGPHQDENEQHQQRSGGIGEPQLQQGMANRNSGGSLLWRKKLKERIRHYEAKLKSHLDRTSKLCHSLSNNNMNGNHTYNKNAYYADHASFNECLLDFWDESFSLTANIHYFDMHSPIPRATRMWEFLSQPCPKALGTIQCEIERMRTVKNPNEKNKRRGAGGMKEWLFPTYEYRLFFRDRRPVTRQQQQQQPHMQGVIHGQDNRNNQQYPHAPLEVDGGGDGGNLDQNGEFDEQLPSVRLDTVLMTAKYRGKKHGRPHCSSGGATPSSSKSKKGVNNYYLYTPQKHDIEQHFKGVNESVALRDYEQIMQKAPLTTGKELGRVQSNFIGTEFQIFSPTNVDKCPQCNNKVNTSPIGGIGALNPPCGVCEGTAEPNSGINTLSGGYNQHTPGNTMVGNSTDNGAHQMKGLRRLRRSRSSRRRKGASSTPRDSVQEDGESNQMQQAIDNGESQTALPAAPLMSRFKSSWLRSHRVIADSTKEINDSTASHISTSREVEIGAITYTANLLGNRPRIMDVCIPKVHSNEWRNYCENSNSSCWEDVGLEGTMEDEKSMLSKLKLLQLIAEQELMHNHIGVVMDAQAENPAEITDLPPDFGLLSLQNRPPWWNVELGAFVLNFGGRVSVASVKNFQLCDRHNNDDSMLQFGRIDGRHSFTMDYSHPLSAVQAFAIAISSLQSKISFG